MTSALSFRDPETAEHCRRVADLCTCVAKELMPPSESYVLEMAALLHDIGKIGIPDSVLGNKPEQGRGAMKMATVEVHSQDIKPTFTDDNVSGADSTPMLIPVALKTLCPTAVLDYDLYQWANDKSDPVLYRERHLPFSRSDIDRLLNAKVHTLYLRLSDEFDKEMVECWIATVTHHSR